MQISKETHEVLKNFASINLNLWVDSGNVVKTVAANKSCLAVANVDETFEREFGIYDMNEFLNMMSLLDNPELSFGTDEVKFTSKGRRAAFRYSPKEMLKTTDKDPKFPTPIASFTLTASELSDIQKASANLKLPDLVMRPEDGKLVLEVTDIDNTTSNGYVITTDHDVEGDFNKLLKVDSLKLIPSDYAVDMCDFALKFTNNSGIQVEYYIALDPKST